MISVIIANWNGKKWLKDCLDSILGQTFSDFEILLIDNASSDDSVAYAKENYPDVKIIENRENMGFGRANNLGAKHAKGEVLFFLNNDTKIENNLFLEKFLLIKKENNLNIAGPKILDFNRDDVYKKRKLTIDFTGYLGWGRRTFFIEGSAMLIDREDFLKLGGFDEKYFMYSEDIDLCWRAWLIGMKVGICEGVSLIHFGGGSSEPTRLGNKGHKVPIFRRYETEKNNLRSLLKNYKIVNLFWILPLALMQIFFESSLYLITGNLKMFWNIWKAIIWNAANIKDTWQARRVVQKMRNIGDREIFSKMNIRFNKLRSFLAVGIPEFK
jgi:GT2 family glycosyltransferase